MKMIEEYSTHYENDMKFHGYDVREILDKVTFYIFPMLNPDGVTLAREGIDAINDEGLKKELLKMVNGNTKLFPQWKANISGVDLNRNYPCKTWGNFENGKVANFRSKPSAYYFGGYSAGTEIEIKTMVDFLRTTNFESFLTYHSRGEIIYWYKPYARKEYNKLLKDMVEKLGKETGYKPVPAREEKKKNGSDGTASDHISDYYQKPVFTIETLPSTASFPVKNKLVVKAYDQVKTTALLMAQESIKLRENNYYHYKVYQNRRFLRDFRDLNDAKRYATKWSNGAIIKDNEVIWHNYKDKKGKEVLDFIIKKEISKEEIK